MAIKPCQVKCRGSIPLIWTTLIAQLVVIMRTRPQRTAAYKSQSKRILVGAIGKQIPILVGRCESLNDHLPRSAGKGDVNGKFT